MLNIMLGRCWGANLLTSLTSEPVEIHQWVAKPEDLSSIPGAYRVEGEN